MLTLSFNLLELKPLKQLFLLKYVDKINGKGHPYMYVSLSHFLPFARILHI